MQEAYDKWKKDKETNEKNIRKAWLLFLNEYYPNKFIPKECIDKLLKDYYKEYNE